MKTNRGRSARRRNRIQYTPTGKSAAKAIGRLKIQFPQWAMNLFRPFSYKIVYGGRGAGRSWGFARAILLICSLKKTRVLCTREIQSSLKDSVHQLMRDQIVLMGLSGFIITDREIRHANGSLIIFSGLRNNIQKVKSIEAIDICWVEEAERVSKESWRVLIPTIRKANAEIWISFNPDQEEDATWQRFVAKKPPRSWVVKVNGDQNPWFTDRLREEREYDYAVDPDAADWIWGGNLRKNSDAQILRGKWIIEDFTVPMIQDPGSREPKLIPQWNGPYQGMDFGFSSDPFAAVQCWIWADVLYVEHEAYGLGVEIDHAVSFTLNAIPGFDQYRTRADSSRPDSISYLRRHGLQRLRPAVKGPNSVEDGIAFLRRFKKIVIHSRCVHTKTEAKLYSYKVDRLSGAVLADVVDKHNHLIDAIRYALEPIMKKQKRVHFMHMDLDGTERPICRVCQSWMPDDGQCVHCGYNEHYDVDETLKARVRELTTRDESINIDLVEPTDDVPVLASLAPLSGNGHDSENGNGSHSPMPKTRRLLRGLNDN